MQSCSYGRNALVHQTSKEHGYQKENISHSSFRYIKLSPSAAIVLNILLRHWRSYPQHALALKSVSKPLFLCICAWRSASWAIDMSMSPLLICAVCLKFVGTPIMLRSILSLWCGLPLFRLFLVGRGVRQHVKHCTQSSLLPAITYPHVFPGQSPDNPEEGSSKASLVDSIRDELDVDEAPRLRLAERNQRIHSVPG